VSLGSILRFEFGQSRDSAVPGLRCLR